MKLFLHFSKILCWIVTVSLVIFYICVVSVYCLEQLLFILKFIFQSISREPLFLDSLVSPIFFEPQFDVL